MDIQYGEGIFREEKAIYKGEVTLGEHKLYLKGAEGDLTQTYIPLEKIESIKLSRGCLRLFVRPSLSYYYTAEITAKPKKMNELSQELVHRRGFKKKFLKKEWFEVLT